MPRISPSMPMLLATLLVTLPDVAAIALTALAAADATAVVRWD